MQCRVLAVLRQRLVIGSQRLIVFFLLIQFVSAGVLRGRLPAEKQQDDQDYAHGFGFRSLRFVEQAAVPDHGIRNQEQQTEEQYILETFNVLRKFSALELRLLQ